MEAMSLRVPVIQNALLLLCLVTALPAAAQQRSAPVPSGMMLIEMPRQAERQVPAGMRIEFAVETSATSARGAVSANHLTRTRVMRVLASTGIASEEIEERGLILVPAYAPRDIIPVRTIRGAQPQIVGYTAVREISVRARDATHAGLLIDLAQGAGASLIAAELR